jgi:hypothetical protein
MMHVSRGKTLLTARREAISGNQTSATRCEVCLGLVGKGKKICSPRCRLVRWGAKAFLKAYRAGEADGLRDTIRELVEVNR